MLRPLISWTTAAATLAMLLLCACHNSASADSATTSPVDTPEAQGTYRSGPEEQSTQAAEAETTPSDADPNSALANAMVSPLYFHGDPCTVDCSGHEAGYEWAEEHEIDDPSDCGGNSESFIEGCESYAEEQLADDNSDEESVDEEDQ